MLKQPSNPLVEDQLQEDWAVLEHILQEHPTVLRHADLFLELADPRKVQFETNDDLDNSLERLRKKGLIYQEGELVLPTPATLYFAALLEPVV